MTEAQKFPSNFLRHYDDVYRLLDLPEVQEFMQGQAYQDRKVQRFRSGDELLIAKNPAHPLGCANLPGLKNVKQTGMNLKENNAFLSVGSALTALSSSI